MRKALAAIAAILLTLAGALLWRHYNPPPAPPTYSETRWLMGTQVTITIAGLDADSAKAAAAGAFEPMERVDAEMARRPGTKLDALNKSGEGEASKEMFEVVAAGLAWAARSGGAFDPTVGAFVDLWAVESGPHPPPTESAIREARRSTGWRKVSLGGVSRRISTGSTLLELGGIAKGYAVDLAAKELSASGAGGFIVDAGGDIALSGTKSGSPWKVGVQDPRDGTRLYRAVTPRTGALVTSGDYERYFEWEGVRYPHIIDPATGIPSRAVRSATVWAEKAVDADALATAICVLGAEKGLKLVAENPPAQALVIDGEGKAWESPGFATVASSSAPLR